MGESAAKPSNLRNTIMMEKSKTMRLNKWFSAFIFGIFVLSSVFVVWIVNNQMRKQALNEAELKSMIRLDQNLAIHTYFSKQLKPKLFEWSAPFRPDDYFDPTWMSSTYAVREIEKYFRSLNDEPLYYKECAIDARSHENEADRYEKLFLERLEKDSELDYDHEVRTIDGQPYYVTLRRGEVMEESCLRCHSEPGEAPKEMVDIYGPERSFHRKVDDIAQAISIRIPLVEAHENMEAFSRRLSFILLGVLAVICAAAFFFTRHFVFKPVDRIRNMSRRIISGDEPFGKKIPLPYWQELRQMTKAFNSMSETVEKNIMTLESAVHDRTFELEQANALLKQEIEERKQAERKALILSAAVEQVPVGIALADENLNLYFCNPAGLGLRGGEEDDLVEIPKDTFDNWQVLRPNGEPYEIDNLPLVRAVTKGQIVREEFIVRHQDGADHICDATASPVYEGNEIIGSIVVFPDISERKHAEEELKRSEALFRLVTQTAEIGITNTDVISGDVEWDETCYNIHGYKPGTPITLDLFFDKILHPDENASRLSEYRSALDSNDNRYRVEYRIIRPDGLVRWIDEDHTIIRDENGNAIRTYSAKMDISRRKQAEHELLDSLRELKIRDKVAEIFLTISDAELYGEVLQVVLDAMNSPYGTFAFINEDGDRVVPSMTRDVWGECKMKDKDIFFPRDKWGDVLWARCLIHKKSYMSNGPFNIPEGHISIKRALATPIIHHGEAIGNLMVGDKVTDYSEKDKALLETIAGHIAPILNAKLQRDTHEKERAQHEKHIKASLREKEVLLREIHHRVKNNLQVIVSLLKLQSDRTDNKQFADLLGNSQDRVKSMALVHEKLYQTENFADINFGGYVKSLTNSLFQNYVTRPGKVSLEVEVSDISLEIDTAIPCGLIINELVSNALKYAFPQDDTGEVKIAIRSITEDDFVLEISDNGVGIPEDLDIRQTKTLGLHLVKILAEFQLDGMVELDRAQGTRFKIKFRRQKYNAGGKEWRQKQTS